MVTRLRSTSVSPYQIEMWDGPKTIVVKNKGVIAYATYPNEDALKEGYYAAQKNPLRFWETHYSPTARIGYENIGTPPNSEPSGISRDKVEEIIGYLDPLHHHRWRLDGTCRCGMPKD